VVPSGDVAVPVEPVDPEAVPSVLPSRVKPPGAPPPAPPMAEPVPMTPQGAQKLRDELARLKEERPKISREIGVAREHGDLKENAEYHAAKDRQGMIEARIKDIEDKLARAEIIDPTKLSGDRVRFGAHVKVTNLDTDEETSYQIVGADEADINAGTISVSAPLARALIGKSTGDEVVVNLPAGKRRYEIAEIDFR
jgi:transcription elongation factor GreA